MADEDFYEAAVRHWIDGAILEEQEEYDNAVCMQGFAAECALKKIMEKVRSVKMSGSGEIEKYKKEYSHWGEAIMRDIQMLLLADMELLTILEPSCALRLSKMELPPILFRNHPERRYFKDSTYTKADAGSCRNAAGSLIKEMLYMRVDGYL